MLEASRDHVFPIVLDFKDIRIQNKIPCWQKKMDERITEIELTSEKYEYSRAYAWRARYRDELEDPTLYESEQEYLDEVERQKYEWRAHVSNYVGIDPEKYETFNEYEEAVAKGFKRRWDENERTRIEAENARIEKDSDNATYKFCKVSVSCPEIQCYYYLIGDKEIFVGDRVIVPFGNQNAPTEAVVVATGKRYAAAFPVHISRMKNVISVFTKSQKYIHFCKLNITFHEHF